MRDPLSIDLYEFTMAQSYFRFKPNTSATFDLFVRARPVRRSFLIACGLADVVEYLLTLRFTAPEIAYLRSLSLFSDDFLTYLKRFRFTGDVWALSEGSVCFENEPIIRITAPIIQAQLIETALLTTVHLQTMIASKAARVVAAAAGRNVFDFSLRRTHGEQAGLKVARASYIAGVTGTSNCAAGRAYGIPVAGTMAHSFVMSFPEELDSFLAYSMSFPKQTVLLVDTYNTRRGIAHAITVGLYLRKKGYRLAGIRIDSGSLVSVSRLARRLLDEAGLTDTKIIASGNLDEYKIERIVRGGGCIDGFGVGTNMGTSSDAPSLDILYKISEVTDERGHFLPAMKLSRGKMTIPGRKQVFRSFDKRKMMTRDEIGLEDEVRTGRPLLKRIIRGGRLVYRLPAITAIRASAGAAVGALPASLKKLDVRGAYPVVMSPRLSALRGKLQRQLLKRRG